MFLLTIQSPCVTVLDDREIGPITLRYRLVITVMDDGGVWMAHGPAPALINNGRRTSLQGDTRIPCQLIRFVPDAEQLAH